MTSAINPLFLKVNPITVDCSTARQPGQCSDPELTYNCAMTPDASLKPFLSPQGVVIVGASQDPTKLGYGLARNLVQSHYQGAVHFVNPKGGQLLGRPIYTSLADVPDPVDLAAVLIPAPSVPAALRDCGARGIRAVIIGSGGFREVGPQGAALEAECLQIAAEHGL
ncbi:MAG: CoA-binding protein, partial [Anaerolineales bacterium]|nr:CoA-binding protein [Anaerolineales bacterium]